jgi:hypothetical protein
MAWGVPTSIKAAAAARARAAALANAKKTQTNYGPTGMPAYYSGGNPTRPANATLGGKTRPALTGPGRNTTAYQANGQPGYMNLQTTYWWEDQVPGSANMTPAQKAAMQFKLHGEGVPYDQAAGMQPYGTPLPFMGGGSSGGGGRGGGGGGGGGGGPVGMDQATFDYLSSIIGKGKPKDIAYEALDLPDPSEYMKWDPSQYGVARQGVATGIEGIRNRGNTAFDQAQGELARYVNPFEGGLQTNNPDLQNAMARMMQANGVNPSQVGATNAEGVQADRAMQNTLAMLAGVDQSRMAGNMRALQGDRTTFDQNLGLEGNMLNLGVNMAEAKGKTAFDQRLQDAMFSTAGQEAMQNWTRRNTVGDTNVGTQNQWNQDTLNAFMQLVGALPPGMTLPGAGTVPWGSMS